MGSLLGWPFAAAVALPFVIEDVFMSGQGWRRFKWMLWAGLVTACVILVGVDGDNLLVLNS